jgi:hypothetical protein
MVKELRFGELSLVSRAALSMASRGPTVLAP